MILARVTTLEEIAAVLATRRKMLGLSQIALDDIAGLTGGYTAKLECGMKGIGKVTLPLVLQALRLELVVMPTAAKHRESYGATTRYAHSPKKDHHAQIGAKGGRARAASVPRKKLRAIAKAGARARWKSERERRS